MVPRPAWSDPKRQSVVPGHGFGENPDISLLERQEREEAGTAAERLGVPDPANSPRSRSFRPSADDPGSAAAIKATRSRCSRARSGPSRAPPPPITPRGAPAAYLVRTPELRGAQSGPWEASKEKDRSSGRPSARGDPSNPPPPSKGCL